MKLVSANLKLCAYEAILVEMAKRADPAFQKHFRQWILKTEAGSLSKIKSGPVKLLARVSEKKFDYISQCKHTVPCDYREHEQKGKHHAEKIALCAGLVECSDNSCTLGIRENPSAAGYICDMSRLSVEVPDEDALVLIVEKLLACTLERDAFQVLRYCNGHHQQAMSPSGYRDVKFLVVSNVEARGLFVHEIQVLLSLWLVSEPTKEKPANDSND